MDDIDSRSASSYKYFIVSLDSVKLLLKSLPACLQGVADAVRGIPVDTIINFDIQ